MDSTRRADIDWLRIGAVLLLAPSAFGALVAVSPQPNLARLFRGTWSGGYFFWYPRQFYTIGPAGASGYEGGFTPVRFVFGLKPRRKRAAS